MHLSFKILFTRWKIVAFIILICAFSLTMMSCCNQDDYAIYKEYQQDKYDNIILLGDTQRTSIWEFWGEQNDEIREVMFPHIAQEKPSAIVVLGDLVFLGSSSCQWKEFDRISTKVREATISLYPVLGNHNYYGNNETALQNYFQRFPYLQQQRWYDRKFGPAAFLFLDSNISQLSDQEIYTQNVWYAKKLTEYENDPQVQYIFVCDHHPPFTNSNLVSASKEVQQYFLPQFLACSKTKIFFSGHCHGYEHFMQDGKHFITSGGGGGPRHYLDPDGAEYKDLFPGQPIRKFNYCKLTFKPHFLFEMVTFDSEKKIWSVEDSWQP